MLVLVCLVGRFFASAAVAFFYFFPVPTTRFLLNGRGFMIIWMYIIESWIAVTFIDF